MPTWRTSDHQFFSRMRSKGSRFTLGVWGLSCVRQTLPNRPQPFPRGRYGRAYGKFCNTEHFSSFSASRRFVSRGRHGSLWHYNMLHDVSKIVFRGHTQYFCNVAFFVAGTAPWRPPMSFCMGGAALSTCRVALFLRIALSALHEVWWQGANSPAGVAFCDMWWKSTEPSYETSILRYRSKRKLVGKHRFWSCEVWNLRKSRTKCSFWCSNMSRLDSLAFWCYRSVFGGKLQNLSFWRFQNRL